jgi:hypothetical protein
MSRQPKKPHGQPTFHPIGALPSIAAAIDDMLQDVEAQYGNLIQAQGKPHVLDDQTVERVIRLYTDARANTWLFDEQLALWRKGPLTESQRRELERLTRSLETLKKAYDDILNLAADLRKGTLDRILEMSDEEVALAFLSGKLKPPGS